MARSVEYYFWRRALNQDIFRFDRIVDGSGLESRGSYANGQRQDARTRWKAYRLAIAQESGMLKSIAFEGQVHEEVVSRYLGHPIESKLREPWRGSKIQIEVTKLRLNPRLVPTLC
jgi:hypothetical protein